MADDGTDVQFEAADDEHLRRERSKARELRQSAWWKNRLGEGQCYYCLRRLHPHDLTMDHIVPVVRGGYSRRGNVVPCCKDCNNHKKHLLPLEWSAHLERLRGEVPGGSGR